MRARRVLAALLVMIMALSGLGSGWLAEAQTPPPPPAAPPAPATQPATAAPAPEVTPVRISYLHGEVSFWRPGATEWAPAKLNTPLAPGDILYTGEAGTVELQLAPRAFVRAAPGTHVGLDNQEPDFVQLRVTDGHAALDVRELAAGHTVELATPGGAFTVEKAGYYPVDVSTEATTFRAHRGGGATVTPAGGSATTIAANQQVKLVGTDSPRVETASAPALSAWDRWNYQRTDYLIQPASAQHVGSGVYGAEELDRHGTWHTVETYGSVWVPTAVAPGWVPYSTGRWIWDPRFGWTWLDDAPWGWAPYHHGRWVHVNRYWAWAPGPIVVRPVYAPALVVFLGDVTVSVGRPVYWAPLYWGEPIIPWWGRPGFIGVATWRGWGGPRVVNNVVVNRNTTVNVTNINVYRNVNVTNAVVGVPADRFGRGQASVQRVNNAQARELRPVRGELEMRPVAASVAPATGPAARPPAAVETRAVVATRAPRDVTPALQSQGLPTASPAPAPAPATRIVPSPRQSVRRDSGVEPGGKQSAPPGQPRVVTPPPPGGTAPQPGVVAPASQPRVVTPDAASRSEGSPRADSPRRERRQGGEAERGAPQPAPATPGAPAPAAPAAPAPKVMNAPPSGAATPNSPAPAAPARPAPRVINAPPSAPPAPSAPAPGAPAAQPPRARDQARPEPRVSAPPRQPAAPAPSTPSIQPAPAQPGASPPPAPPRLEQRPDRSERPGRIETPRARIEAPQPQRQEQAPERLQERAPRPEPRMERGAPERGVPERGNPERGRPDRGGDQGRG